MFFSFIKSLFILALLGVLIWMLMDVLNRDFPKSIYKVLWFVFLTFVPVIGMIAYYWLVMRKQQENLNENQ